MISLVLCFLFILLNQVIYDKPFKIIFLLFM